MLVDVNENDQITLYVDEKFTSAFYYNNTLTGIVEDPEFTRRFAGIWLSENTTRPGMREDLLGIR